MPYIEIKGNGEHEGINIEIPVEEVRATDWPYFDEYACTSGWAFEDDNR